MRSTLLDAAGALFREHGLSGTSMTAIAAAADAFPSQVTYYFRSKEALFIEALTLTRRRQNLVPQVARTIERLHVEGARAYAGQMTRHGWRSHYAPEISSWRFWTLALGIALEGHATGRSSAAMAAAMREALGDVAAEPAAPRLAASSGRVVGNSA
jgi:AcrR family transcriptional regulator